MRHRILLVDSEPGFLELARELLADSPNLQLVGTATDAADVFNLVASRRPETIILDIDAPARCRLAIARQMRCHFPHVLILMTGAFDDPEYERLALLSGAAGFLSKRDFSADAIWYKVSSYRLR